jgi:hypothetical protein
LTFIPVGDNNLNNDEFELDYDDEFELDYADFMFGPIHTTSEDESDDDPNFILPKNAFANMDHFGRIVRKSPRFCRRSKRFLKKIE